MTEEKLKMSVQSDRGPGFGIRHLQVIIMFICSTVIYAIRSSMGAAILGMTDISKLNNTNIAIYVWSEEIRGVILSSFFWGYTLMQIPAGVLCEKYGGKPLLAMALVVNGTLALITPISARYGGWIAVCVLRVCMGLSQACFMPAQHTLLGQWAPPQERTKLAMFAYAGIQIGTIITMPVCGLLSNTSLGWVSIFYSMGGLSLVTSAIWWGFSASTPREHRLISESEVDYIEHALNTKKEETPIPWRDILTSVPLLAIASAHIGMNWVFVIFLVQMPSYLKNVLGISLSDSATIAALPFFAQWICSMSCSYISDYLCNRNIMTLTTARKTFNSVGAFGCCIGLIVMSFISAAHKEFAVLIVCFAIGMIGCNSCGFLLNHIDLSPRYGGVMFALTNCVANVFGVIGPLSTGFILGDDATDISRWRIVLFLAAGFIMVSNIIYVSFGTSELQKWNDPCPKYEIGLTKKSSIKNNETKEETVYKFPEKE